jgi:cysteinyl-tRNA synthetase
MIMVYDSLRRQKVPLVPIEPGHVRIYTCGVTPYASSHLGHARPAVIWDVIRRHLKRRGYLVTYVQNFTDIDDKIIRRAHEEHIAVTALAERHIREYEAMMAQLGVQPPDISPRVTDNIEEIIDFIQRLIAHGHAYAEQGDVYFAVRTDPQYGTLSGRQVEAMMDSGRIEPSPYKHAPEDFALWKASAPDEPGWDSPWGRGRPGWHIECSAMSCKYLGTRFDLHGGGVDLIFPHHENERAQSRAYSGQEPVSIWVHNGLITRGQVKMSKSLDNGAGLADLLRTFPPLVVRTYLLSVHYRSPLEFEPARLTAWQTAMQRLWHFWAEVQTPSAPRQATGLAGLRPCSSSKAGF